jgi:hypothetical protein
MSLAYHPKGVVVAISPGAKLHGERARAPWMTLIGHCYIDDEVPASALARSDPGLLSKSDPGSL